MPSDPKIDCTTPAVVLDTGPRPAHHDGLAAIRGLGRLGIGVYGVFGSPRAPAAQSRYLSGRLFVPSGPDHAERVRAGLVWLAKRIGCRAVLLPGGSADAIFLAEWAAGLEDSFLIPRLRLSGNGRVTPEAAIADYLDLTGQGSFWPRLVPWMDPSAWFAGDDILPFGLACLRGVMRAPRLLGRRGGGRTGTGARAGAGARPGPTAADYRPGRGLPGRFPGAIADWFPGATAGRFPGATGRNGGFRLPLTAAARRASHAAAG
jgi:hypothetical protein